MIILRLCSIIVALLLITTVDVAVAKDKVQETAPSVTTADQPGRHAQYDPSARIYASACAACHYNGASRSDFGAKSPAGSRNPDELLRAILFGKAGDDDEPGVAMPGFAAILDDGKIAGLAAYLRSTRTTNQPWPDVEARVAKLRRSEKAE